MIERFSISQRSEYQWLLEFLNEYSDMDFYYTENNNRIYITDSASLKKLFRNCHVIYTKKEKGDYVGIILIWKSIGGGITRYYVKVVSKTSQIAKDLLTVLLWNCSLELYTKIRKDSKFLSVFKSKNFKFIGIRGIQILLKRDKSIIKKGYEKDSEENI